VSQRKRQWSKRPGVNGRKRTKIQQARKSLVGMAADWFSQHRPVFLFLFIFGVLIGLFYVVTLSKLFYAYFFPWYLQLNANLSGAILTYLRQDITVAGECIFSSGFSIRIARGCDAVEPIALFICAVLAFPAPFTRKIPGIIAGSVLMAILNSIRIVSLFLIGVHFPQLFNIMHLDVWQGLFIFLAIVFWVVWLLWVKQSGIERQHA